MGHNQFGQIIFPELYRISDNATICKKTKLKTTTESVTNTIILPPGYLKWISMQIKVKHTRKHTHTNAQHTYNVQQKHLFPYYIPGFSMHHTHLMDDTAARFPEANTILGTHSCKEIVHFSIDVLKCITTYATDNKPCLT